MTEQQQWYRDERLEKGPEQLKQADQRPFLFQGQTIRMRYVTLLKDMGIYTAERSVMIKSLYLNKILWMITAVLSLAGALAGIFLAEIYGKVTSADLEPALFGQDLMTAAASLVMLVITILVRKDNSKKQIVILGILGYLFYAYGIYVIERLYNALYYLYLAAWGLSFWSLVYGLAKVSKESVRQAILPDRLRMISAGFSLLVALVFTVLWIIALLPLIQTGEKIEFYYSIYILDLCFIMPAFAISGITALRKMGFPLLLMPSMFVLGFTLIFSLVISEAIKPLFDLTVSPSDLAMPLALSCLFLALAIANLLKLKTSTHDGLTDSKANY